MANCTLGGVVLLGACALFAVTAITPASADPTASPKQPQPGLPTCPPLHTCVYYKFTPAASTPIDELTPPRCGIPGWCQSVDSWDAPGLSGEVRSQATPANSTYTGTPPNDLVAAEGQPPSAYDANPEDAVFRIDKTHYVLATGQ